MHLGCPLQVSGNALHTMHLQHGFHVKSPSGQFPTIQEASQAEESGDSVAVPAAVDTWRMSSSKMTALPRVGTGVKGLLDLCADSTMANVNVLGEPLPGSPVEVVGTVHSSKGVRRLVKAVVRGLRACQVPHTYLLLHLLACMRGLFLHGHAWALGLPG